MFKCKVCLNPKPLDEFYKNHRLKRGHNSVCKICLNKRSVEWGKAHPEKRKEASQRWRERNPDKVLEANRKKRPYRYNSEVKTRWYRRRMEEFPEYRARLKDQGRLRSIKLKKFLNAYKLEKGCADCGYKKSPYGLHFDHVRGEKKINICFAKSISGAKKEIKKCEVRCANCHAERHAAARNKLKPLSRCLNDLFEEPINENCS